MSTQSSGTAKRYADSSVPLTKVRSRGSARFIRLRYREGVAGRPQEIAALACFGCLPACESLLSHSWIVSHNVQHTYGHSHKRLSEGYLYGLEMDGHPAGVRLYCDFHALPIYIFIFSLHKDALLTVKPTWYAICVIGEG